MSDDKKQRAFEALDIVGACANWNINVSSEHCRIAISGFPLFGVFDESEHVFVDLKAPFDLEACILQAAAEFEATCYPHHDRLRKLAG